MKKTIGLLVMFALLLCIATAVWSQETQKQIPMDQQSPAGIEKRVIPTPTIEGPTPMRQPGSFRQRMGSQTCPLSAFQLPPAAMFRYISQKLQLSEDQSKKLLDIVTKSEQTLTPLRAKAQEAINKLQAALVAEQYDAANVQVLAQNAQRAEAAIITAEIDTWTQIRSLLTAEQVKLFVEMIQDPMKMMGDGITPARQNRPGRQRLQRGPQQPLPERPQVEEK